jgi:hypothetical protein
MHPVQVDELKRAIVFMKMHELRDACQLCGIPSNGRKQELIERILSRIQGFTHSSHSNQTKLRRRGEQEFRLDALMFPETYTNGAMSRAFLTRQIGNHFRFTVFGMDWIHERWAAGQVPTFSEFIEFWQKEYQRRKVTADFVSKPQLARVNLFRKLAEKSSLNRAELEQRWKEDQASNALKAQRILSQWRKLNNLQK